MIYVENAWKHGWRRDLSLPETSASPGIWFNPFVKRSRLHVVVRFHVPPCEREINKAATKASYIYDARSYATWLLLDENGTEGGILRVELLNGLQQPRDRARKG